MLGMYIFLEVDDRSIFGEKRYRTESRMSDAVWDSRCMIAKVYYSEYEETGLFYSYPQSSH